MPADLGQGGGDLGQTHAVSAEPFGHTERGHAAVDQRLPGVVTLQHRGDDVGDGLLAFVWTEIHPILLDQIGNLARN